MSSRKTTALGGYRVTMLELQWGRDDVVAEDAGARVVELLNGPLQWGRDDVVAEDLFSCV